MAVELLSRIWDLTSRNVYIQFAVFMLLCYCRCANQVLWSKIQSIICNRHPKRTISCYKYLPDKLFISQYILKTSYVCIKQSQVLRLLASSTFKQINYLWFSVVIRWAKGRGKLVEVYVRYALIGVTHRLSSLISAKTANPTLQTLPFALSNNF